MEYGNFSCIFEKVFNLNATDYEKKWFFTRIHLIVGKLCRMGTDGVAGEPTIERRGEGVPVDGGRHAGAV